MFPSVGRSVGQCYTTILTMVKSFILSLNFARSLKKDRSNRSLFDIIPTNDVENDENVAAGVDENVEREIPSILNKDVSNFRAQGFSVDDNNEPAPENIPNATNTANDGMYRAWGSEHLDARRVVDGVKDVQPTLVSADASMHTLLGFFLHFLPLEFFRTTILQATNKTLSDPLTWDESLQFISILLLFVTT